ncbi:hypothetical protein RRF57_007733 [Xylaria bambusicola]|uniref:Uncharacterized protein n=1 Tax=Xylaria bambusicola TaxID=326684 RepID=A0AAN7UQY0_9PEZI
MWSQVSGFLPPAKWDHGDCWGDDFAAAEGELKMMAVVAVGVGVDEEDCLLACSVAGCPESESRDFPRRWVC